MQMVTWPPSHFSGCGRGSLAVRTQEVGARSLSFVSGPTPRLPKVFLREKPQQTRLWAGVPASLICLSLHPQINSQGCRAGRQTSSLRSRWCSNKHVSKSSSGEKGCFFKKGCFFFLSLFLKLIYFDGRIIFFTVV